MKTNQLILHIPHSSIKIPFMNGYTVNEKIINNEILKLTDWFTDDLFASETNITIKSDFSRIFCDVERFADNKQEFMFQFGMGVIYTKTDSGKIFREVNDKLREKILINYYWKHHKELSIAVKMQLQKNNHAMIVDCHSFPNIPFERDLNKDRNRPDFNLVTNSFHTPQKLIDFSIDFFKKKGHSIWINRPYQGTIVPLEYYQKDSRVLSIMLEINRKLYLNENSNDKSPNYLYVKNLISEYLNIIKSEINI